MALKKSDIPRPLPPAEAVPVEALGGEVIVRGLLLSERLEIAVSTSGSRFKQIPKLLALTVVDADQLPIFSETEWEAFGARHFDAALSLFKVAQRLSGLDGDDAEKN